MGAARIVFVCSFVIGLGWVSADARAECPSLSSIQSVARRYGGIQEVPVWRTRSRWSAVLPILSVHGNRDVNWQETSPSSRSSVGAIDRAQGVDVRLTWRLDRLLFDPDEPRLFDAEQKARKARVALDQEVARSYFLWRKAVAARVDGAEMTLAGAETFAQVDAFTGGWLTRTHCQ